MRVLSLILGLLVAFESRALTPTSFSALALSQTSNVVTAQAGPVCLAALQPLLRKGAKLNSKRFMRDHMIRADEYPDPQVQDLVLFHYTNRESVQRDALAGDGIVMGYQRRGESTDPYLYLAGDELSSSHHGMIQLLARLKPDTLIFVPHGMDEAKALPLFDSSMPLTEMIRTVEPWLQNTRSKLAAIENEIISRYPELESCRGKMDRYNIDFMTFSRQPVLPLLVNLAAEHAGAGLILYKAAFERRVDFTWFQLIDESIITKWTVGTHPSNTNATAMYNFRSTFGLKWPDHVFWRKQLRDFQKTVPEGGF